MGRANYRNPSRLSSDVTQVNGRSSVNDVIQSPQDRERVQAWCGSSGISQGTLQSPRVVCATSCCTLQWWRPSCIMEQLSVFFERWRVVCETTCCMLQRLLYIATMASCLWNIMQYVAMTSCLWKSCSKLQWR